MFSSIPSVAKWLQWNHLVITPAIFINWNHKVTGWNVFEIMSNMLTKAWKIHRLRDIKIDTCHKYQHLDIFKCHFDGAQDGNHKVWHVKDGSCNWQGPSARVTGLLEFSDDDGWSTGRWSALGPSRDSTSRSSKQSVAECYPCWPGSCRLASPLLACQLE